MCQVCTEAVHCAALGTRVTLGLDMRQVCSPLRRTLNTSYIRFGHVSSMYRGSPLRSTLNTSYIGFGHVSSMYRGSPLRSTLNTSYIRFGHVSSMYRSRDFTDANGEVTKTWPTCVKMDIKLQFLWGLPQDVRAFTCHRGL